MTLYELSKDYIYLLEVAEDPDIDPEALADTMEGIEGAIEDKAEGYVCVIKELEGQAAKFDAEIDRLTKQKNVFQNNIKRIKETLMNAMIDMGKEKIPTEHFKISVAKNGGLQPMVIDVDLKDIPEEYITRKPEPNNAKIREALKTGDLPFAHLEERGRHLNIR